MRITIPGEPIAKARHRCMCRGRHAVAYDPQSKEADRTQSKLHEILANMQPIGLIWPLSSYLNVTFSFHMQPPVNLSKPALNAFLWNQVMPSRKDLSNQIKFYEDIGNGILWKDDSQIVDIKASMRYSETPCTIIEITPIIRTMDDNTKKVTKLFSPAELDILKIHCLMLSNAIADDFGQIDIERASPELIDFANGWGQKLAKLAKMGDK